MRTMNANPSRRFWIACLTLCLGISVAIAETRAARPPQGQQIANVLVVTMDGMRWQEVFGGLQSALLTKEDGGVDEAEPIAKRFGAATPEARRQKLMPFFWDVVAKQGQVFGDPFEAESRARDQRSLVLVPGLQRAADGRPDPRIDSNDRIENPNTSVLEWLNHQAGVCRQSRGVRLVGAAALDPEREAKRYSVQRRRTADRVAVH